MMKPPIVNGRNPVARPSGKITPRLMSVSHDLAYVGGGAECDFAFS